SLEEGTRVVRRRPAFVPKRTAGFVLPGGGRAMASEDLKDLADRAAAEIAAAADEAALEAARVRYLGRKEGALTEATKRIAALPPNEKPAYGAALNDAKRRIGAALDQRGAALRESSLARDLGGEREDMTLPPRRVRAGRLRPITPPIRVVVPGRCYRYEATDAIRESIFFQYEGLAIDEKLTMADLKGTLYAFARQVFGSDRKIRFRIDYFPFTEPSAEIAFDCFACEGRDPACHVCGGDGWIEAAGCGMVHPDVLRRVGYDPSRYQGFAFGGGIERLAMLRTGAPDIRLFYQN